MLFYTLLFVFQINNFVQVTETKMSAAEIAEFKQQVQTKSKNIKTITTDFNQNKKMAFLENDIASKGRMLLNAQGFLKWQYTEPNKYSIIFKNDKIYINDNGTKSTANVDQRLFKKISALISSSIKGDVFNDTEFVYDYYKKGNTILVKMTSKDKTLMKYIKNIELTFPKDDFLVSEVKLIEPSGDFTLITFKNRKINAPIENKEFDH